MVTLMTCNTAFEAELVKGQLNTAGIECMVTNECMNTLYAGISATFTRVDVLVNDEDFERAQAIVAPQS